MKKIDPEIVQTIVALVALVISWIALITTVYNATH